MRYILILLLVCSCSNLSPEDKARMQEANGILSMFEQDYYRLSSIPRYQHQPIRYRFADLSDVGEDVVGVCYVSGNTRYIHYDRDYWDEASYIEKVNLVYHEQGHCQLDREHRCSTYGNLYSLMYPYLLNKEYLESHLEELKTELFSIEYQRIDDCNEDSDNLKRRMNE